MSTLYMCDKCEVIIKGSFHILNVPKSLGYFADMSQRGNKYDDELHLCNDCLVVLRDGLGLDNEVRIDEGSTTRGTKTKKR